MFGYACINTELNEAGITTNRSMIRRTFDKKGVDYCSDLALKNTEDILKIFQWNEENNFRFFRMSSDIFPWASEYELEELKDFEKISESLKRAGDFAKKHNHRITFHPGPFNKLCSSNERIVNNTIGNLELHGKIFDLMGLSKTHYNKINIHIGGAYGDKVKTAKVFLKNFERLSSSVYDRLTLENDDNNSLYSVKEIYELIHKECGIPIVIDLHHHKFHDYGLSEEEALSMAIDTWYGETPVIHYSESKSLEQKIDCRANAHSDYVYNYIDTFGNHVDVMIEAKKKELAVKKYLSLHRS